MRDDSPTADLVTRARDGDARAWNALVDRFGPLIWSICRSYRLERADIEDVAQNVWLKLVGQLSQLRDPAALGGWLATTTRRECFRTRQAADKFASDGQAVDDLPEEDAVTAEDEVLLAERHAALREAFARLPLSSQRLLALLAADPPVPYAEISAWLGMAIGSIGPNRRRSLDRLRHDPAIAALIDAEAPAGVRSALRPGRSRLPRPRPGRRDLPACPVRDPAPWTRALVSAPPGTGPCTWPRSPAAQRSSWRRIRLPAGSRKAQSRIPYGCSTGSWTTSASLACSRSKVPSRSLVARRIQP
jgi:RNA polymerase sigma factor (sigma-70 family)